MAAPLCALALFVPSATWFFPLFLLGETAIFVSTSPINAVVLETIPAPLRATAMAASIFAIHALGDLWSPPGVGLLMDHLPVAVAMLGTGARRQTVAFLGWFGPRGLASIVFAVITIQEAHLAGSNTILLATYLTVGLSVAAHGITAAPLARRYAEWYEQHPPHRRPAMESVPAPDHRSRGSRAADRSRPG